MWFKSFCLLHFIVSIMLSNLIYFLIILCMLFIVNLNWKSYVIKSTNQSQLTIFREIVSGLIWRSEGGVWRNGPSLDSISMVIHEVALSSGIEDLPGPGIHLIDVDLGLHFPEVLQEGFKEHVIACGQAQVLEILLKLLLAYFLTPRS